MDIFDNVRREISTLIPSSIINDIACFVLYDNHPRREKNIDITICTKNGELREYSKRDLKYSLDLKCIIQDPSALRIIRNNNSELFYLLASTDKLFIISSKATLAVHTKLTNVDRYEINDADCSGEVSLKIVKKDDAVPIIFNSNFQCMELVNLLSPHNEEDSYPILNELKRKLVEARYTTKCNEKTYSHYLNLHQKVSFLSNQCVLPNVKGSVFQDNQEYITNAVQLKTSKPWVKVCNSKIIAVFNALIASQPIKSVHILLNTRTSINYTTRIFTKIPTSPYWHEEPTTIIKGNQECMIVAVIDLEEFKQNVTSRIELSGSIAYEMSGKEWLVPFEDVVVSSMEVLEEAFDVLSRNEENIIIAIMASSEKTELLFRHMKGENESDISILDLFCTHLKMERVENAPNVIVYSKSPYHALNGTMIIFHGKNYFDATPVSVYTRSQSQVLTLLHCIHDAIPAKIIHTAPTYRLTSRTDELSRYSEQINTNKHNYTEYATSMLDRTHKILEHLDKSMIKMNESRNPSVLSKVGTHIDLFADGKDSCKNLKNSLNKDAKEAVDSLMRSDLETENVVEDFETNFDYDSGSDIMIIH